MPIPKIILTAAVVAANLALTMTRKIEGPRLDDLKFTGGDYGVPLPMIWGLRRIQTPIFWAEDLREVRRRRKTKGGKFNDYSYFGTWAVALAGHEIEGVRRIWFDTHLVFDLSGAGPVTPFDFGASGAAGFDDYVTIYLGTSTQDPDPRMQATVEARFGEGSCPAYRNTAYIVFKDIPLEKIGNRIPQVSVEVVGSESVAYPVDVIEGEVAGFEGWRAFSPDFSLFMAANPTPNTFTVYDVAARAVAAQGAADWDLVPYIRKDGSVIDVVDDELRSYDLSGRFVATLFAFPTSAGLIRGLVYDGNDVEHRLVTSGVSGEVYFDEAALRLVDLVGVVGFFRGIFTDLDGNIWGVGKESGSATSIHFCRLVTIASSYPAIITVTGLPAMADDNKFGPACHYREGTVDHFVFEWGDALYAAAPATGTVTASQSTILVPGNIDAALQNLPIGSKSIWVGVEEFDLSDLTELRQVALANWDARLSGTNGALYDPVNHALVTSLTDAGRRYQVWCYLDRIDDAGVALSQICGDVADWCGVESYDFSDLTQVVTGWSATRGPASNIIEPLLDAYDSDIRPHDFTIQGLRRTGVASGATLLTERFVGDVRYSVRVRQASELPRAVLIDFADTEADQQPNSVRSDRPISTSDARGENKIDLSTAALGPDEARGLADRHFRRIWNERRQISLGLTAQELALEPGDVRTLSLDGSVLTARCVRVEPKADDTIATDWRYDVPSLALLDAASGAAFDGRTPQQIAVPLISKGFVLDLPLLSDADAAALPALYTAAAPLAAGTWPGAGIFQSVDGEYSDEFASIPSSAPATWGRTTTALGTADPAVWDRGRTVNVVLQVGTLAGTTEAAIDADPTRNLCLIGGELINFTTAALQGDGSYTLSGFKRGRRGTEAAVAGHAAGETFVLLDTADAQSRALSDVGTTLNFKAITSGRTEAGAAVIAVAFTGATLKPLSPVHLSAAKQSNGDWLISWVRRTRVGGAWTSGTPIPLSEVSEEYSLTVGNGTSSAIKTVTAATSYTWTLAAQTTDTGGEVLAGDLEFSIAQVSDAVGNGFVASAAA